MQFSPGRQKRLLGGVFTGREMVEDTQSDGQTID
jgi:hypothetical protein